MALLLTVFLRGASLYFMCQTRFSYGQQWAIVRSGGDSKVQVEHTRILYYVFLPNSDVFPFNSQRAHNLLSSVSEPQCPSVALHIGRAGRRSRCLCERPGAAGVFQGARAVL